MFFNFPNEDFLRWNLKPSKFPKGHPNNFGGKVLLPHFILQDLVMEQIEPPYIFNISTNVFGTNCGVLEFTAPDGEIIVPEWIFSQLDLKNVVIVKLNKETKQGKHVKLLPHSVEFLEVDDPKTELEENLKNYQVLTQGDEILCKLNNCNMRFTVDTIEPECNGIYIVDTDLSVEFLPPIGYEEKVESERTVEKYVEITEENGNKIINMHRLGLWFNYDKK